jgi:hypothetical protein
MTTQKIILSLVYFILFLGFQLVFGRNLEFFSLAFCFVYVGAFLLLPIEASPALVMVTAFVAGILVDMFCNTPGVHAAASVGAAFLRAVVLRVVAPAGGYEGYMHVSAASMGIRWFLLYATPLLFVHALSIFLIEYTGVQQFALCLLQAVASTLFTLALLLMVQYALYRP